MLTTDEVNAMFNAVPMRFSSYYKYSFTFKGEQDGFRIVASFGGGSGGSDSIYCYSVSADEPRPFGRIENWHSVDVYCGEEKVFDYYNPW